MSTAELTLSLQDEEYTNLVEIAAGGGAQGQLGGAQSPKLAQNIVAAFAPYGINLRAPTPSVAAGAQALSPSQAAML